MEEGIESTSEPLGEPMGEKAQTVLTLVSRSATEQKREKFDLINLNQIMDRACVRDDEKHKSEAEPLQGLALLLEVFHRVFLIDAVGL